jgi:hypothetical protein
VVHFLRRLDPMPTPDETPWHALDVGSAVERLATDSQCGLDTDAIGTLRIRYGPNELTAPVSDRSGWCS